MRDVKVVIIGAGIAGIAAAERLFALGIKNVVILEGEKRVGGRIHTTPYGESIIEMGAQWIHGEDHNPVFEMARAHNLVDMEKSYEIRDPLFYLSTGAYICPSIIEETQLILDNIFNEATKYYREKKPLDSKYETMGEYVQESFYKHLKESSDPENVKRMKEGLLNWRMIWEKTENACASINDMSLYAWGEFIECEGENAVELRRGYQPVLDLMLNRVPKSCFRLGTKAVKIIYNRENTFDNYDVAVVTNAGDIISADHVIVTCSLGVLKSKAKEMFYPPLPQSKLNAIDHLGFGTVNKIYLEFDEPFWGKMSGGFQCAWVQDDKVSLKCLQELRKNEMLDENLDELCGDWYRGIHGFDVVVQHTNLLCGWIAGVEAEMMEKLPDDLVLKVCHELLQIFTNRADIPVPTKIIRTNWRSNENTLGSYSYRHKGSCANDSMELSLPLTLGSKPVVMFAGEATHQTFFSTTHGALLTGQREAERINEFYFKTKALSNREFRSIDSKYLDARISDSREWILFSHTDASNQCDFKPWINTAPPILNAVKEHPDDCNVCMNHNVASMFKGINDGNLFDFDSLCLDMEAMANRNYNQKQPRFNMAA